MKFYTQQHDFYCGIDLHARTMYLCILNKEGQIVLHKNMESAPGGGKAKNDKIDAHKIAGLMRGGMFPQAYVYPSQMRSTRICCVGACI